MTCPNCRDCAFLRGVCERLANRGRRFFLMGALAVPVAAKIARVAEIVLPPKLVYEAPKLTRLPDDWILHNMSGEWAVAT